jgi:hypothetical protein
MSIFGKLDEQEIAHKKEQLKEQETERNLSVNLGDLEKTYKEGLTTLKDLIAPSSLKFESSYFELNGKLGRSFFVLAYPALLVQQLAIFHHPIRRRAGPIDVHLSD